MIKLLIVSLVMISTYVLAQCVIDKQVLEVTVPTGVTTDCSLTTAKKYQLQFEDASLDLTYLIDNGVYTIDTVSRGATLTQYSESGTTKDYQLTHILVRSPPMFRFTSNVYQVEMQMYFNNTSAGDDIIFSSFFQLSKSSSSDAQFFDSMDPTIVGDKQSVNLYDTLKDDLADTTNIYEYAGLTYQSKAHTWLISDKPIYINQQHYEAIINTWVDPYILKKFDNIDILNGQCVLDKANQYAFCMNGIKQIFSIITLLFVFLI